ncbi:MAG TPA: molybdenum cofactor guanylyltransferase [Cytophagaceae bacterium]|nr:molybdenum cofactor guanylyltransferase [Cytophagaceae bacterium]
MLTGIIMCGGQSSRMGKDKGLLIKDGQCWAMHGVQKLEKAGLPVKLSVNPSQKKEYQKIFSQHDLIEDKIDLPGPAAGLCSAYIALGTDLLLLACDMTDVSVQSIRQLIHHYEQEKDHYDFFVFKNNEALEPLFGIYSAAGIQKIHQQWQDGTLDRFSMKYLLEQGKVFAIAVEESQEKEFRNYNSPLDIV